MTSGSVVGVRVEVAVPATAAVGEGPHYDPAHHTLTWVDIPAGDVHLTDLATGRTATTTVPTMVGAAVPSARGAVLATAEGFATLEAGRYVPRVAVLDDGERMNDAKCDPTGRFWAGSCEMGFADGAGRVHVLHPDWSTSEVLTGLALPNGMGWSPDGRRFHLVDSVRKELWSFAAPGAGRDVHLSDRRLVHRFDEGGVPDGLAVDVEGGIWVAIWGGSRVVRVHPDGGVLRRVEVPAAQPSSCAFGGPRLDTLYVTTARAGLGDVSTGRADGAVLAVHGLGVRGVPVASFGIGTP